MFFFSARRIDFLKGHDTETNGAGLTRYYCRAPRIVEQRLGLTQLGTEGTGFEAAQVGNHQDASRGDYSEHKNYFEQREATLLIRR